MINSGRLALLTLILAGCGGSVSQERISGALSSAPAPATQTEFGFHTAPLLLPVGRRPLSLVLSDLNRDGTPDVASANNGSDDISVLLSESKGRYRGEQRYESGQSPFGIEAGDLDEDGDPDLISTNYGGPLLRGSLSVYLNRGDGTFEPARRIAVGDGPTSVIAVDLDGDGNLDLACTNFRENTVTLLRGDGQANFSPLGLLNAGERTRAIAAGDLNGDGKVDLATGNEGPIGQGDVSVFWATGNGVFSAASTYLAGQNPHSIKIADLNDDSQPDLVVANFISNDVSILQGQTGSFVPPANLSLNPVPLSVTIADLNLDGRLDLAVATQADGQVALLAGSGAGQFAAPEVRAAGQGSFFVDHADLDRDGRPDLAVANAAGDNVSLLFSTP